jgi:hypothetical protein
MPTQTIAGALLTLTINDNPDDLWTVSLWSEHTGVSVSPLSDAAVNDPPAGLSSEEVKAIKAFAANFASKNDNQRLTYIKKKQDNDAMGRDAWVNWVSKGWHTIWRINKVVNDVLCNNKMDPYQVMMRANVDRVRTATHVDGRTD